MTKAVLPEMKTTSMRDSIAGTLRKAFADGYFQPGEDISEMALASQLKVSRGPIRDALLILNQEGLLTYSQNRGFSVVELTGEDFQQIDEVRLHLETLALNMAREQVSGETIALLTDLKSRLVQAFRAGDLAETTRWDLEFHSAVWQLSRNAWLEHALRRIMAPYYTFVTAHQKQAAFMTTAEALETRHRAYIDFLLGQSSRSAEDCVRYHLSRD